MSLDSMPLLQWPEGIPQASVPANSNALLVQALFSRALGVENDAPGTEYNGAVYIVGDTPVGDFANFNEHDIALYEFDSWHAWSPTLGASMVIADERMVFDGAEWVEDPSVTGGGSGDVVGPASSTTGNFALFADATGKEIGDGGTPGEMAFVDDAPSDGTGYVRKNGAWAAESGGGPTAYTIVTEASASTATVGTNDGLFRYNRCGGDVTFDSAQPYTAGMVFNIRATAAIELVEDGVTLTAPAGGTLELTSGMSVQIVMTGATTGDVIGQTVAA